MRDDSESEVFHSPHVVFQDRSSSGMNAGFGPFGVRVPHFLQLGLTKSAVGSALQWRVHFDAAAKAVAVCF
jgi:hypothetical protein